MSRRRDHGPLHTRHRAGQAVAAEARGRRPLHVVFGLLIGVVVVVVAAPGAPAVTQLGGSQSPPGSEQSGVRDADDEAFLEEARREQERRWIEERLRLLESRRPTGLLGMATPSLQSSILAPPPLLTDLGREKEPLQFGNVAIMPSVAVNAAYDHFVRGGDSDEEVTSQFSSSLRAQSLFERHSLGAQVQATADPFDRDEDEPLIDWTSAADGRLDLTRRSSLSAGLTFTRGKESEESPEVTDVDQESTVTQVSGTMTYTRQHRRLGWSVGGGVSRFAASGETSPEAGDEADERDRTSYSFSANADYAIGRRTSVFAGVNYGLNEFDAPSDGGSRDSQVASTLAGLNFTLGRSLSVSIGAGYTRAFLDDPQRSDSNSFNGVASLNGSLDLDRRTSLQVGFSQSTGVTAVEDAAIVTTTALTGSLTRSLSRASAVLASVDLARGDYFDTERTDHDIAARVAYSHSLSASIALNVSYRFSKRFSEDAEDEFYRNLVSVGLSASF